MSDKEGRGNGRVSQGNVDIFASKDRVDIVISECHFRVMPFDFSFGRHWTFGKRGPASSTAYATGYGLPAERPLSLNVLPSYCCELCILRGMGCATFYIESVSRGTVIKMLGQRSSSGLANAVTHFGQN